jgi:biopolymer transport protein ExbD
MTFANPRSAAAPLGEINMTPLIDVLLVLLVVLVITIPPATHSLAFDLPREAPIRTAPDPVRNRLVLEQDGALLWNGRRISEPELVGLLAAVRAMRTEPQVEFEPEANARYEASTRVLDIVKASGITRFGFAGNEKYRVFGRS